MGRNWRSLLAVGAILVASWSPAPAVAADVPFTLTYSTALGGDTLELLFSGAVTVDWGDGGATTESTTHTYSSAGTYNVSVTGTAWLLGGNNAQGRAGITSVGSYGSLGLTDLNGAFAGASHLTSLPPLPGEVTNISWMLANATSYNENVDDWDTSGVTNMEGAFYGASAFNNGCAVGAYTCPLNPDGSLWDTSQVTTMRFMFGAASGFNQDVGQLDTSAVTTVEGMFYGASSFNNGCAAGVYTCPLDPSGSHWDTSHVTNFGAMFHGSESEDPRSAFNQRVSNLSLASATNLGYMFRKMTVFNNGCAPDTFTCPFTTTASAWQTGNVTHFNHMFLESPAFNQSVSGLDTHSVVDMTAMFGQASSFNNGCPRGITSCPMTGGSGWDMSQVTNAAEMFKNAHDFDQDVHDWDLRSLGECYRMFNDTSLSTRHYSDLLVHLVTLPLGYGRSWGAYPSTYAGSAAIAAHDQLTSEEGFGWGVWDGGVRTASTIYVDASATGAANGTSWVDAYPTLTPALAAAIPGDEVWVAAGTYRPTSTGDRTASFQLPAGVEVHGGFAGDETTLAERPQPLRVTRLSGNIGDSASFSDNSYHVVVGATGAVLDGVTVTGGNADGSGMYAYGGGLYNMSASPTVTEVVITGNRAAQGGGVFNGVGSSPVLRDVTISHNQASQGGGMYNFATSNPTLTNAVILANTGEFDGGAIFNYNNSVPVLATSTVTGNNSGIASANGGNVTIRNSIVWGNGTGSQLPGEATADVRYSLVQNGYTGTGNVATDPRFIDLSSDDVRLRYGSPAIDSGDPTAGGLPTLDRDGLARVVGARVDLGAYEFRGRRLYVDATATGSGDGSTWTDAYPGLADALAVAGSGDVVWVAAGTYTPGAARSSTFQIPAGVEVHGGFVGDEASLAERPVPLAGTVLSGDLDGNDAADAATRTDNAYHVVTGSSGVILEGVTVTAGNANGSAVDGSGGGVLVVGSNPLLLNLSIHGNAALAGGGVASHESAAPRLENVVLTDNTAGDGGALAALTSSSPVLTNVTIAGNAATGSGAALLVDDAVVTVHNGIVWGNGASAVVSRNGGSLAFDHSVVAGDAAPPGTGNTNSNPQFADLAHRDLRLVSGSPAIDAGASEAVSSTTDRDGVDRVAGTSVDQGAYEFTPPVLDVAPVIAGADSATVGQELSAGSGTWLGAMEYGYQWLTCNAEGGSCAPVASNGDTATYTPVDADAGHRLRVQVTATSALGYTASAQSAATVAVAAGDGGGGDGGGGSAPINLGTPAISGLKVVSQTLIATSGTWLGATTYAYRWQRCDAVTLACTDIVTVGPANAYTLTDADLGYRIQVVVTAGNADGSTQASSGVTRRVRPLPHLRLRTPGVETVHVYSPVRIRTDAHVRRWRLDFSRVVYWPGTGQVTVIRGYGPPPDTLWIGWRNGRPVTVSVKVVTWSGLALVRSKTIDPVYS